ncbi:MAG: hypothetical protein IJ693_04090 [Bacteroidaceae bacterium]|nr:hypothetical protein [Bacteroidaceae bacterium]
MITQLSDLFLEGNMMFMSILTLLLALLFLAAWKAPAWVCDIGNIALVLGILFTGLGAYQACDDIQKAGDIATSVLCGGIKCMLISPCYGLIIYAVSRIIKICQTPRI